MPGQRLTEICEPESSASPTIPVAIVGTADSQPALVSVPARPRKPSYARAANCSWSSRELMAAKLAYQAAGLEAAYLVIPHRSKAAVRGQLQRIGVSPVRSEASFLTH